MSLDEYLKEYPPVLSVDDIAAILCITPKTARGLIGTGKIKGVKIGRIFRVPKDRLIAYLEGENSGS